MYATYIFGDPTDEQVADFLLLDRELNLHDTRREVVESEGNGLRLFKLEDLVF